MATQPYLNAQSGAVRSAAPAGLQRLAQSGQRDSYLYVPPRYDPHTPMPLVLLLHGAGGHAHDGLRILLHLADAEGLILVAPASSDATWDVIAKRAYGADVRLVDNTLDFVFARYAIDPARLAIGGFSDGASYALTLGLANGDLFTHVIAFSPGFIGPVETRGKPKIFISHGTADRVLPIDPCSRTIVRQLNGGAHRLHYHEFEGGHTIPPELAARALDWFSGRI
ncbi:MAG TPA: alpha/beta hydrolase-fold protein [Telluria sp.]|jgi:predicted esterase